MSKPIKVMIVDDSALVRKAVSSILNAESDIQVAGMASDPYEAKDQIRTLAPDVIILDLEMPKMDGLTFLKLIMERRPCPVIIFSTLSTARSKYAIEAYKNGAFDVLGKPTNSKELTELAPQLLSMVRAAGQSKIQKNAAPVANPGEALNKLLQPQIDEQKLILIGASTGGTEAINTVLSQLPAKMPPIAIVQHIPEFFCAAFVDRLNGSSRLQVGMARHGEDFGPGQVRVSPG
ncbi:MAG: response regulator, partial [Verrucomicrobia bacterium]|nr:response regulator [Verrucomicrobiota bacterium]